MTEQQTITKADLLAEIERDWTKLSTALDQLTETQLTTPTDTQGWTAKDHVIHIIAWERSVVTMLRGKPRHEGLGVAENLYLTGDMDAINAVIQTQHQALPLAEALAQLRQTHQQLLTLLEPLTDQDLQQPYRHYLPDEPGEGDGPLAINVVYANSTEHFREHLDWIEDLTAG
jgi:uncharacterized protein (TIGR03083 family)